MTARATTQLCAIVGDPIAHSYSPAMHEAAFTHLGLDLRYAAFRVPAASLAVALAGARALGLRGLSVTAPHKEATLALCTPDDIATKVGAVNTLVPDGDMGWRGTNTDVHGVERSIAGFSRRIDRVVLLGAGGAARAVLAALGDLHVDLFTRTARRLSGTRHDARAFADQRAYVQALERADLLVDATPRGREPGDTWPIDALPAHAAVLDLTVQRETPLTRAAVVRGLAARAGDEMLLQQGALAFTLFTGQPAPIDVMRRALAHALDEAP